MRRGFCPHSRIWVGGGGTEKEEEEEEEEKIPHMCESIGHRPLRGRCPKTRPDTRLKRKSNKQDIKTHSLEKKIGSFIAMNIKTIFSQL